MLTDIQKDETNRKSLCPSLSLSRSQSLLYDATPLPTSPPLQIPLSLSLSLDSNILTDHLLFIVQFIEWWKCFRIQGTYFRLGLLSALDDREIVSVTCGADHTITYSLSRLEDH
ncbi:hypothetical protein I3842_08G026400 [Carya illinoinensis]|uniref:Uncharacterized protein n=1 Tax=Carya illinoinensis TaxID=32201 RepID=A0A922E8K0_CARIL|nr:hypothetical protein I3842_08G026400 [Carya illinoinensis]